MTDCPINCINAGCNKPDFLEKHNAFLLTIIGSLSAILGMFLNYLLKSRCKNIRTPCCSCDREVIDVKVDSPKQNN